jgi:heavy metal sensor kinase
MTLEFILALALALGACGILWFQGTAAGLRAETDERLLSLTQSLAGSTRGQQSATLLADLCTQVETGLPLVGEDSRIAVLDLRGACLCASSPTDGEFSGTLEDPGENPPEAEVRFFTRIRPGAADLRGIDYPLLEGSAFLGVIRVTVSQAPTERILAGLKTRLMVTGGLALVLMTALSLLINRRRMEPLTALAEKMDQITAENLAEQRLPEREDRSEPGELVRSYNALLTRLDAAMRRARQFSADAAHELRTPLTVLRGETEVALRWTRDPEEFRSTLESNLEEIDRMGRIIEDLLLLAKSEAGELPMEKSQVNLNDLLRDLYQQGKVLGENKGIAVTLDLPETEVVQVMGDELRLHQMGLNLVTNGIKYTPTGGSVRLKLECEGDQAVIAVSDTGHGMAPEHLSRIFDRFYRIDKNREQESGAGLGLSIVKWIVDAHEGRITVTSQPNEGSEFKVFLPRIFPDQPRDTAS